MLTEIEELDKRIRTLCACLLTAEDGPEMGRMLCELGDAVHAHTEGVRKLAYATLKGTLAEEPDTTSKAADQQ